MACVAVNQRKASVGAVMLETYYEKYYLITYIYSTSCTDVSFQTRLHWDDERSHSDIYIYIYIIGE